MIIGDCPYDCGHVHAVPIADHVPAYERLECEGCGRTYWLYHSRLDPWAMTDEDFRAEYIVNEGRSVVPKMGAP